MKINGRVVYQFFKYSVYALLTINVFIFLSEELAAARLEHPDGVVPADILRAFASSIDTAAWVVLLLMFELETYILDDDQLTRRVAWTLQLVRVACYFFIVSAFTGYVEYAFFVYKVSPLVGIDDLCMLADQGWGYAVLAGEYVEITAANCASFTSLDTFMRFDDLRIVVDEPGMADIKFLSWVDIVNAGVWLLVVLLLEIDVRLQERNRFEGAALYISSAAKVVLYSTLVFAVIAWAIKGDVEDWWDALLWLVAFVFIELNVFEWREESKQEAA